MNNIYIMEVTDGIKTIQDNDIKIELIDDNSLYYFNNEFDFDLQEYYQNEEDIEISKIDDGKIQINYKNMYYCSVSYDKIDNKNYILIKKFKYLYDAFEFLATI